jgi:hypothetical protein
MKREDCSTAAVVFAALVIIGCSVNSIMANRKRRTEQREQSEVAQQTWEGEGGAVRPEPDEQLA